jgi:hypothetical protein
VLCINKTVSRMSFEVISFCFFAVILRNMFSDTQRAIVPKTLYFVADQFILLQYSVWYYSGVSSFDFGIQFVRLVFVNRVIVVCFTTHHRFLDKRKCYE